MDMRPLVWFALLSIACVLAVSCSSAQTPVPTLAPTDIPPLTATSLPSTTFTPEPTPLPTNTPTAIPVPSTPTLALLELTSTAFAPRGMIPTNYVRYANDISPPLAWSDPPEGTQSLALVVYSDPMPDGGGNWVQWILYNIPPETRTLPEGVTPDADGKLSDGSQHYENSWGELAYGGPNPQQATTHSYYFELYALDTTLDLEAVAQALDEAGKLPWIGPSKTVFLEAIEGHVLAKGELIGRHKRESE
ncbi:MAG: YbhB/YbcL family Raf kinase inhibitor-like protein [Proteobacteria bacterium]|nr:YbhB/YbcL family Raf kinase inhibitor-like protein [Pseudomonadota bacterium]